MSSLLGMSNIDARFFWAPPRLNPHCEQKRAALGSCQKHLGQTSPASSLPPPPPPESSPSQGSWMPHQSQNRAPIGLVRQQMRQLAAWCVVVALCDVGSFFGGARLRCCCCCWIREEMLTRLAALAGRMASHVRQERAWEGFSDPQVVQRRLSRLVRSSA